VGPTAGLDAEVRGKILCLCRASNRGRPVRSQTLYRPSYRVLCKYFVRNEMLTVAHTLRKRTSYVMLRPQSKRLLDGAHARSDQVNTQVFGGRWGRQVVTTGGTQARRQCKERVGQGSDSSAHSYSSVTSHKMDMHMTLSRCSSQEATESACYMTTGL
jgi:hypothetical protein